MRFHRKCDIRLGWLVGCVQVHRHAPVTGGDEDCIELVVGTVFETDVPAPVVRLCRLCLYALRTKAYVADHVKVLSIRLELPTYLIMVGKQRRSICGHCNL